MDGKAKCENCLLYTVGAYRRGAHEVSGYRGYSSQVAPPPGTVQYRYTGMRPPDPAPETAVLSTLNLELQSVVAEAPPPK